MKWKFPLHIYGFLSLKHVRASSYARYWSLNAITDQKLIRRILQAIVLMMPKTPFVVCFIPIAGKYLGKEFLTLLQWLHQRQGTSVIHDQSLYKRLYIYWVFMYRNSFAAKIPWHQFWNHTSIESCFMFCMPMQSSAFWHCEIQQGRVNFRFLFCLAHWSL